MTSIGKETFAGCNGLTSITIPNSVTKIEEDAFNGCSNLSSVTIPNSVTSIERDAFEGCNSLSSITISDIATWCNIKFAYNSNPLSRAHHLFLNGEEIKDLIIPNSVTSIRSFAFEGCSGLTSVTIPNSVTSIEGTAFLQCYFLTSVNISDIAAWCNIWFDGNASNPLHYAQHLFLNGEEIKELAIPNSVTRIKSYAFEGCAGLTSITFPNSVTSIGECAFKGCVGLTSITFPNSVTNIESYAFSGCDIPKVISKIENPFDIGDVFSNNTFMNATLYVPIGTIDKYKVTKGWKKFVYIEEGEPSGIEQALSKTRQIESKDGVLTIRNIKKGTPVSVYNANGTQFGSAISQSGQAAIDTNLPSGSVAIVKIGEESVKVIIK